MTELLPPPAEAGRAVSARMLAAKNAPADHHHPEPHPTIEVPGPSALEPAPSRNGHSRRPAPPREAPPVHTGAGDTPTDLPSNGGDHRGQLRLAYRLAGRYTGHLLHVHGLGWHRWDGARWTEDDRRDAMKAVYDTFKVALHDAAEMPRADRDRLHADVRKCESAAGVDGVLRLASAMEPFAATVADLDPDPYLLNVQNGTLDLRTMELRDHDPADRITKVTEAAYHPDATAPAWDTFLARVLPNDDVRGFTQRLAGIGLLGKVVEHVLAILTGVGANGKTTFTDATTHALGDYARHLDPELFMHRDGAHPTGQMDLLGVRWAIVQETEKDKRLAVATMKRLTGGDKVTARRMHKDFVSFQPSHTALLFTNHLPKVPGDDPALWRRIRVVPFDVVIPTHQQDKHLTERLQLEADGILAWAVAGYQDWAARGGLDAPDAVKVATDRYHTDSDVTARFIAECCLINPHMFATTTELFERWVSWSAIDGAEPMSRKAFGEAMDRRGYPAVKSTGGRRLRRGIGLASDEDDEE